MVERVDGSESAASLPNLASVNDDAARDEPLPPQYHQTCARARSDGDPAGGDALGDLARVFRPSDLDEIEELLK